MVPTFVAPIPRSRRTTLAGAGGVGARGLLHGVACGGGNPARANHAQPFLHGRHREAPVQVLR